MRPRLKASQVYRRMANLLRSQVRSTEPAWLAAMEKVPPGPTMVRDPSLFATCPRLPFESAANTGSTKASQPELSPSRFFVSPERKPRQTNHRQLKTRPPKPPMITFPEDRLRRRFYKDHPHELLRARSLQESTGINRTNWSRLVDPKFPGTVTGEHVIQHQLYLMTHKGLSEQVAYAQVLKEFYAARAREDLELKLAEEQAYHFGARPLVSDTALLSRMEGKQLQKSEEFLTQRDAMRRMQNSATEKTFVDLNQATSSSEGSFN
ncbi:mitochondrial ribosomal small subunit component [Dimargaris xerosporica]|nr:mitochondrial ribosomal small subunit component [Dimargaris xerosporica]